MTSSHGGPDPARMVGDQARLAYAAARSALRRYPRHLLDSLRRRGTVSLHPERGWDLAPITTCERLGAAWLGHATALLRVGGTTILTDPVLGARIGPRFGKRTLGLGRMLPAPPAESLRDPTDIVLISHAHFDHLDKPTLARLAHRTTTVVTPRRTARLIPEGFAKVVELDWGGRAQVNGVEIEAVQPAHWGARSLVDRRRGYNAYAIRAADHSVFFAGDTADTDAFDRMGEFDLAVFGIGAYEPWVHAHATPEQVWGMFQRMNAGWLLPVHHGTFELSDEHPDEPLERLLRAAGEAESVIVGRSLGEAWLRPAIAEEAPGATGAG